MSSETPAPAQDTKRRLAPQISFKPDPSYENGKKNVVDAPRKTVIRFTREVLIAKRKPNSLMACMAALAEIVSETPFDPVCFETLEPEDVIRVWNAAKPNYDGARGRGRSRMNKGDEDNEPKSNDTKDLWDAEDTSAFDGKPFDFSKVAEDSEKFRSELDNMKKGNHAMSDDPHRMEEIDMDSLVINHNSTKAPEPAEVQPAPVATTNAVDNNNNTKMTKIEFGSLLTGNQSSFAASFETAFVEPAAPSGSSLLSKIGVKLEPDRPVEWNYRDPSNNVQGPFSQLSMRQWNKEGYFAADLPIQVNGWKKFHLFNTVFPDMANAFSYTPDEPSSAPLPGLNSFATLSAASQPVPVVTKPAPVVETVQPAPAAKPVQQASERISQPQQQQQQNAQQQQQNKADVDRSNIAKKALGISAAEAQAQQTESNHNNNSARHQNNNNSSKKQQQEVAQSTVNSNNNNNATNAAPKERKVNNKESVQKVVSEPAPVVDTKPKGWNKDSAEVKVKAVTSANLLDIQEEQRIAAAANASKDADAETDPSAPPSQASIQLKSFLGINASKALGLNTAPKKWSTPTAAEAAAAAKSLQDIMSEEMSQKRGPDDVAPVVPRSNQPHSWASKAAKTGGANPVVHTSVPTVLSRNTSANANAAAAIPPAPAVTVPSRAASAEVAAVSPTRAAPVTNQPQARGSSKSDFGGKAMSSEMSEWCNSQLRRLNLSQDLSGVLDFCMSLKSSAEIRETLSTYLGSSAQVTNFATEFIRYKEEGKRPSSDLNSAGASDPKRGSSQPNGNNSAAQQQKRKITK